MDHDGTDLGTDLNMEAVEPYSYESESEAYADLCDNFGSTEYVIRSMWMYAGYPILAVGTVGHVLSVLLLLVTKSIRQMPVSVFLLTMSLAGLVSLYIGLLSNIVMYQSCLVTLFRDMTSEFGCRLHVAALYVSFHLYSWMEACVAVERMAAVRWPHRYRSWFTRRNNSIAVGAIFVALCAVNYVPFRAFGYLYGFSCQVVDETAFGWWLYVHGVVYVVLPAAMVLASNGLTLHAMCSSKLSSSVCVRKAKPITAMMIALNATFVVTAGPLLVVELDRIESSATASSVMDIAWSGSRLLAYLGNSLTFVVYLAMAARFRRALGQLVTGTKRKQRDLPRRAAALGERQQQSGQFHRRTSCSETSSTTLTYDTSVGAV